jgi:hypothetical protein
VLFVEQPRGKGKELAQFFDWATHEGQSYTERLHYARLPPALVERVEARLRPHLGPR